MDNVKSTDTLSSSRGYVVSYKSGLFSGVIPKPDTPNFYMRDYAFNATQLLIDGVRVDLLNPESIGLIDTGISIAASSSSVGRLDNDLRFQAYRIREAGYHEQSVSVLRIAQTMMERYLPFWKPDSFFSLSEWLYEDGRDSEAEIACKHIREIIEAYLKAVKEQQEYIWETQLRNAELFDDDYAVLDYVPACCEECAKYRSRVYSLSGKDKRLPELPEIVRKTGKIHEGCTCSFSIGSSICVLVGVENDKPVYLRGEEAIRYSNRPFVDDRTEDEKARFTAWKEKRDREIKAQNDIYDDFENLVRIRGKNRRAYSLVCKYLPDNAPKSSSAYVRMKNQKTKKYLLIKERMEEKGIDIEVS